MVPPALEPRRRNEHTAASALSADRTAAGRSSGTSAAGGRPSACGQRRRRRRRGPRQARARADDLDLGGAGAEAGERIDEPLETVLVLDDLLRRRLLERVRLVVEDEGLVVLLLEDVEPAVDQHTI